MKVSEERAAAETREHNHRKELARGRKELNRRVPPQPVRDDRGERKPWRSGLK